MSNAKTNRNDCPDCDSLTRRDFLKTTVGTVAAASVAAAGIITVTPRAGYAAAASPSLATASQPETLVATLYKTLNEEQRKVVAFPFDHQLRRQVNNNWFITKKPIKELFNPEQQAIIRDIFNGMHSPEYAEKVMKQVEHDNGEDGGFGSCAVAMFGEPATGGKDSKFEFVLTGRHVTRRCDGNSVAGAAFGGPIFYGHQAGGAFNEKADHPGNIYWYQAMRANEVFKALDGKQQKLALRGDPRKEEATKTVRLAGKKEQINGLPVAELSRDQKELVRKVMGDVLAPFRKADVDEALALIEKSGGIDQLSMSFFNNEGMDVGKDGVWDVWQIEGPTMLWYFRGAPHVHTWVHIRDSAEEV
jgi:hypothetical protein